MGGQNKSDRELLDRLNADVTKAKAKLDGAPDESATRAAGMAVGLRMGSEFVAAVLVGAVMGYGVDLVAHTLPLGLLVGMLMGFAAGAVNVVRVAKSSNALAAEEAAKTGLAKTQTEKEDRSL
jgi:ATP synthase protein I